MERFKNKLARLLDVLYDAALDAKRWPIFFDALVEPFGAASGSLDLFDAKLKATRRLLHFGRDPAFIASYTQHYAAVNPYPPATFIKAPVGKVMSATEVVREEDIIGTAFFNDWMRPQGISPRHLRLVLQKDRGGMLSLAIAPHERATRRSFDTYTRNLELLAPHIVRAVALNRCSLQALGGILQAFGAAAFLLDRAERIVAANSRGEGLLRDECVLRLDGLGGVHAARPADDGALRAALAKAEAAPGLVQSPVRLLSSRTGRCWLAWIVPNRPVSREESRQHFPLIGVPQSTGTLLLLLTSANPGASVPAEAIMAGFRLSAGEARLVSALVAGRTLQEYAAESGHSRNTARNQLAVVFEKTGTRRQSELVALIAGCVPFVHVGQQVGLSPHARTQVRVGGGAQEKERPPSLVLPPQSPTQPQESGRRRLQSPTTAESRSLECSG
jgi:DNA-binding CsgD family transcriptional regulator